MNKKPINIQSKIRMCPLITIALKKKSKCLRFECMWFREANKKIGTPNECSITEIGRNTLDIWQILDKIRVSVTD